MIKLEKDFLALNGFSRHSFVDLLVPRIKNHLRSSELGFLNIFFALKLVA